MSELKNDDLRIRRTLMLMKAAYKRLVVKFPKNKINVTKIADETPMNRRTFYLHYQTVDELMMDVESDYVCDDTEQMFVGGGYCPRYNSQFLPVYE